MAASLPGAGGRAQASMLKAVVDDGEEEDGPSLDDPDIAAALASTSKRMPGTVGVEIPSAISPSTVPAAQSMSTPRKTLRHLTDDDMPVSPMELRDGPPPPTAVQVPYGRGVKMTEAPPPRQRPAQYTPTSVSATLSASPDAAAGSGPVTEMHVAQPRPEAPPLPKGTKRDPTTAAIHDALSNLGPAETVVDVAVEVFDETMHQFVLAGGASSQPLNVIKEPQRYLKYNGYYRISVCGAGEGFPKHKTSSFTTKIIGPPRHPYWQFDETDVSAGIFGGERGDAFMGFPQQPYMMPPQQPQPDPAETVVRSVRALTEVQKILNPDGDKEKDKERAEELAELRAARAGGGWGGNPWASPWAAGGGGAPWMGGGGSPYRRDEEERRRREEEERRRQEDDRRKEREEEKRRYEEEKHRAEEDRRRTDEEKRCADEERRRHEDEERRRREDEERRRADDEKKRLEDERRRADDDRKREMSELRMQFDNQLKELQRQRDEDKRHWEDERKAREETERKAQDSLRDLQSQREREEERRRYEETRRDERDRWEAERRQEKDRLEQQQRVEETRRAEEARRSAEAIAEIRRQNEMLVQRMDRPQESTVDKLLGNLPQLMMQWKDMSATSRAEQAAVQMQSREEQRYERERAREDATRQMQMWQEMSRMSVESIRVQSEQSQQYSRSLLEVLGKNGNSDILNSVAGAMNMAVTAQTNVMTAIAKSGLAGGGGPSPWVDVAAGAIEAAGNIASSVIAAKIGAPPEALRQMMGFGGGEEGAQQQGPPIRRPPQGLPAPQQRRPPPPPQQPSPIDEVRFRNMQRPAPVQPAVPPTRVVVPRQPVQPPAPARMQVQQPPQAQQPSPPQAIAAPGAPGLPQKIINRVLTAAKEGQQPNVVARKLFALVEVCDVNELHVGNADAERIMNGLTTEVKALDQIRELFGMVGVTDEAYIKAVRDIYIKLIYAYVEALQSDGSGEEEKESEEGEEGEEGAEAEGAEGEDEGAESDGEGAESDGEAPPVEAESPAEPAAEPAAEPPAETPPEAQAAAPKLPVLQPEAKKPRRRIIPPSSEVVQPPPQPQVPSQEP